MNSIGCMVRINIDNGKYWMEPMYVVCDSLKHVGMYELAQKLIMQNIG